MLTPAQNSTFKTAINAETDATLVALRNAHDDQGIANWYNGDHATTMIWKPSVPTADAIAQVVWSEFEGRTQAQRDTWFALTSGPTIDATKANVRNGFASSLGNAASAANLTAIAQRKATRFEALFTTSNVSSMFGYFVSATDVALALAS